VTRIRCLAAIVCGLLATPALAQDWAREMFDHTAHDFGALARGAKAEHRFTLQNVWVEDVHIASISSSCGCTQPEATKTTLRTWEKADIIARIDTRSFMGAKEASVTIRFDQPMEAVVVLHVSSYIRGDVVVQPGLIELGTVPVGTSVQRKVAVSYAGRADWKLVGIETPTESFNVRAFETSRTAGQITYELNVELKPTVPAGYIKDHLTLLTNDANARAARVPVPIEGLVVANLTARPSPLNLGTVVQGQAVTKPLVVQGQGTFRVTRVSCSDTRFKFSIPPAANSLHMIQVTFTADGAQGSVDQTLTVETDGTAGRVDVPVHVRVMPAGSDRASSTPASPKTEAKVAAPAVDRPPLVNPMRPLAREPAAGSAERAPTSSPPASGPALAPPSAAPSAKPLETPAPNGVKPTSAEGKKWTPIAKPHPASPANPPPGTPLVDAPALLPAGEGANPLPAAAPKPATTPTPAQAPAAK